MSWQFTRLYTWVAGLGLLAQGSSTLTALLVPAFDRAVPGLLQETQMVPTHSLLHIGSGLLALAALARRGTLWPWRYAIGLGLFYVGLAVAGEAGQASDQTLCLGLKPFDHSFHAALGSFGLLAAGIDSIRAAWASRRLTS